MKIRGDGRIFMRGSTWWVQFYVDGRQMRESSKTGDAMKAEKYLRGRLKEVHAHELDASKPFVSRHDKLRTIAELMDALKTDFRIRGKDSRQNLSNIARARADFGATRAISLTAEQVDRYIEDRLQMGDAKASVNRVTQLLGQAYKLAGLPAPRIRRPSEKGNARQGFFSESEIRRVIGNLPAELQDFALFGWLTGMRKGEIASLAWEDVDGDVIRLRAENAKNGEARMIPLEGELAELIERRRAARQVKVDGIAMICSLIFHRDALAVMEFRKSWATACCSAGVGQLVCPHCLGEVTEKLNCAGCNRTWKREKLKYVGRLFHDLRRSACRNMLAAGVPQTIAMKISGHKTDSMFRRYAIVSETDLRTALQRMQQYLKTVKENVIAMPSRGGPASERGQFGDNGSPAVARRARK
jgi:integrase